MGIVITNTDEKIELNKGKDYRIVISFAAFLFQ